MEDDKDDEQLSTAANPYGALKARYESLLQKALRIQNFLDDAASQLERVQVRFGESTRLETGSCQLSQHACQRS